MIFASHNSNNLIPNSDFINVIQQHIPQYNSVRQSDEEIEYRIKEFLVFNLAPANTDTTYQFHSPLLCPLSKPLFKLIAPIENARELINKEINLYQSLAERTDNILPSIDGKILIILEMILFNIIKEDSPVPILSINDDYNLTIEEESGRSIIIDNDTLLCFNRQEPGMETACLPEAYIDEDLIDGFCENIKPYETLPTQQDHSIK